MDIRAVREAKKQLELITALPTAIAVQPFEKGPRYQKKEIVAKLPKGYVAIVDNKDRTRFTRMPMETLKSILITYQDQIGVKRVKDLLDKAEREGGRLYTSHPKVLEVVQRQGLTFTAEPEKPKPVKPDALPPKKKKVYKRYKYPNLPPGYKFEADGMNIKLKRSRGHIVVDGEELKVYNAVIDEIGDFKDIDRILDEQEAKEEARQKTLKTKTKAEIVTPYLAEDQTLITIDGVEYIHDTDSNELIGLRDLEIMGFYNIGDPPTGDNVDWSNETLREIHETNPQYKGKKKSVMKVEQVVFPDPSPQAPPKKQEPKYTQYPQLPIEFYWGQQYAGGYSGQERGPVEGSEVIYKKSDNNPLDTINVVWSTDEKVLYDENFDEIEYASIGQRIRDAVFWNKSLSRS